MVLSLGLPTAVHPARAPGLSGQDPLLPLQLPPGVNQTAHHAEVACGRQLPSQEVIVNTEHYVQMICITFMPLQYLFTPKSFHLKVLSFFNGGFLPNRDLRRTPVTLSTYFALYGTGTAQSVPTCK